MDSHLDIQGGSKENPMTIYTWTKVCPTLDSKVGPGLDWTWQQLKLQGRSKENPTWIQGSSKDNPTWISQVGPRKIQWPFLPWTKV